MINRVLKQKKDKKRMSEFSRREKALRRFMFPVDVIRYTSGQHWMPPSRQRHVCAER